MSNRYIRQIFPAIVALAIGSFAPALPSAAQPANVQPGNASTASPSDALSAPVTTFLKPDTGPGGLPPLPPKPLSDETARQHEAYEEGLKDQFPLTPDEIRDLRRQMDARQKAASEPVHKALKAITRPQDVTLQPGEALPSISVQAGYATTLSVFDITGTPWQIQRFVNGNPEDIAIEAPVENGHFLVIRPKRAYASGNLVILLKDVKVPLVIDLAADGEKLDGSVKMRVTMRGPDAKQIAMATGPEAPSSPELASFLQGLPPSGSEALKIDGIDARGWLWKGHYYIRTRADLNSPAPLAQNHDADLGIYEISPVAFGVFNDAGRRVEATIRRDDGYGDFDDRRLSGADKIAAGDGAPIGSGSSGGHGGNSKQQAAVSEVKP